MSPHTNKRRTTRNLKTKKKEPKLSETQSVWKSPNQGVKEETFIWTGRRGGDWQTGKVERTVAKQQLEDLVVQNLHMNKLEGTTRE